MPQATSLSERMDRIIWWLVYGGLFTLVVGVGSDGGPPIIAWGLGILGAIAAAAGTGLMWVRSRLRRQAAARDKPHPERHA
jgi:hypothetical protein